MSKIHSIEAMRLGLAEAIAQSDWQKARRHIDRLKGIVLDSLLQNDPKAIQLAGQVLQQAGERLELVGDIRMVPDRASMAWQLRADVVTAALAARIRPLQFGPSAEDDQQGDVSALLIEVLRKNNTPMSNSGLVRRTGKDPAVISRVLKRLAQDKRVQRWRGVRGEQMNALPGAPAPKTAAQLNCMRLVSPRGRETELDARKQAAVEVATALPIKTNFMNRTEGKIAVHGMSDL
jgi:hypothetical protein